MYFSSGCFLLPSLSFLLQSFLAGGHFSRHSRQSGDDRKCPGRRMGLLRRRVLMEAAAPGDRRGTPLSISVGHVSLGLFRRWSNKSVLFGCPCTPGGSSVKPLLTAVVGGVIRTCPDFLTETFLRNVETHISSCPKGPRATSSSLQRPLVVRTSHGIAQMLPTIHGGTYLMQLISCRVKEKATEACLITVNLNNVKYHLPVAGQVACINTP